MIQRVIVTASAVISMLELLGFIALNTYLRVLDLPTNLVGFPVFELPRYAFDILTDDVPLAVIWTSSIAIYVSIIRYLIDKSNLPIIVTDTRATTLFPWDFVHLAIARAEVKFGPVFLPMVQATCVFCTLLWALGAAGAAGNKAAVAALAGRPSQAIKSLHVTTSVRLDAAKEKILPAGIVGENRNGSLALLWEDEHSVYVAPRHESLHRKKDRQFVIWYAVSRDQIASIKYDRALDVAKLRVISMATRPSAIDIASLVAFIIAIIALPVWIPIYAFRRQRLKKASFSVLADEPKLQDFVGRTESFTNTIFYILKHGRDIELVTTQGRRVTQRQLIRHEQLDGKVILRTH